MTIVSTDAALSDYYAHLALNYLFNRRGQRYYLGLHDANPTSAPPNELFGGGYVRDEITFANASGRAVLNNNACAFTATDPAAVLYLGVWDSISAGHLVAKLKLASPLRTYNDGRVVLAAGDIAFRL